MNILRILATGVAMVLAGGCMLVPEEYQPTTYYDLKTAPATESREPVTGYTSLAIGRFQTLGPYQTRMVYQKSPHHLVRDEYNRWILPPDELVAREYYRNLAAAGMFKRVHPVMHNDADLVLRGVILRLEATPDLKAAVTVVIRIEERGKNGNLVLVSERYSETQPIQSTDPEAFASASSTALSRIIARTLRDLTRAAQNADPGVQAGTETNSATSRE